MTRRWRSISSKGDVGVDTLKRCIKTGTITGDFRPVLCGTAFKNKGVQPLLDAVIDYLPSPVDVPGIAVAVAEGQEESEAPSRAGSRPIRRRRSPASRSRSSTTNTAR